MSESPDDESIPRSVIRQSFDLMAGPLATTMVKLIATSMICVTSVLFVWISAAYQFPPQIIAAAIICSSLSIAVIWAFTGRHRKEELARAKTEKDMLKLRTQVLEMEERLGNAEVISAFNHKLASREDSPSTMGPLESE